MPRRLRTFGEDIDDDLLKEAKTARESATEADERRAKLAAAADLDAQQAADFEEANSCATR